jgi:hypothetical protein
MASRKIIFLLPKHAAKSPCFGIFYLIVISMKFIEIIRNIPFWLKIVKKKRAGENVHRGKNARMVRGCQGFLAYLKVLKKEKRGHSLLE